jgi:hypothetical protein
MTDAPGIDWIADLRRPVNVHQHVHDEQILEILPAEIELRATVGPVWGRLRPGDSVRGSGVLSSVQLPPRADGRPGGIRTCVTREMIYSENAPPGGPRCHFARILVRDVRQQVSATDAFPPVEIRAKVAGPWIPATRWDHLTLPILHDGCLTSLGALADAMDETDDPLAGRVRDLQRVYLDMPHIGVQYLRGPAAAVAELFQSVILSDTFGVTNAA